MSNRDYHGLELAIIGLSGRFPGAGNLEAFWHNLANEVDSIVDLSDEQMLAEGADPATLDAPTYVKKARRLDAYDCFDASFFGISPREAEIIDPQQRIFLEAAWSALEDAGYDPARFGGMIGVFAGTRLNGYFRNVYSNPAVVASVGDLEIQVANDKDYVATRVSYKLDLGGPSVTVQTACSTALVALHTAGQALLNGECEMALAGAVGLRVPETGHIYVPGDVLSPDGKVRAFDHDAAGTMFASGGGVMVLRRLQDALRDGDRIRAVVKGSAITNDGAGKVGFTAPGLDGQVRVLHAASIAAEAPPETLQYIEAHGTGTQLGDPIEVAALSEHFRRAGNAGQRCALGSVKTNIGHLGAAAGIASVAKTVLALEHGALPASLNYERPNPEIDFANSPFYVNTALSPWPESDGPRRAGISAFGMGGTNAHVILEEAPPKIDTTSSCSWQLIELSGRTESAAVKQVENLATHLETGGDLDLADVAYTLQTGRRSFQHRRIAVVRDTADAITVLRGDAPERLMAGFADHSERPVAFMFPGQGAQYPGMARGLYRAEAGFRATVDDCCQRLREHLEVDLRALLAGERGGADTGATDRGAETLRQTAITQPALFVVEYALARLLIAWGVRPESMIGHSIGEYVAACLAGVFSLDDALALVAARGRMMQKLPSGAMLAVPLTEATLSPMLGEDLSIAVLNAPERAVVAGEHGAVAALAQRLAADGVRCRPVATSHAFHSPMMEPVLVPFAEQVARLRLSAPEIPFVSNLTGTWIRPEEATDAGYWAKHLRATVRFADGLRTLTEDAQRCLLEVGPGRTLTGFARQQGGPRPSALRTLRQGEETHDDLPFLLGALGQVWLAGGQVDPAALWQGQTRRRVGLPSYPFERQRFWIQQGDLSKGWTASHGATQRPVSDYFSVPFWKPSAIPRGKLDADHAGAWLLFADDCGLALTLANRLEDAGQHVVMVAAGEAFARQAEARFVLRPDAREDYVALIAALAGEDRLPDHIAHLFSVGGDGDATVAAARGFWSLLYLAQALGARGRDRPISLVAVSDNLHPVAGETRLAPEKACLLGPSRIMPLEYPNLAVTAIDLVLPPTNGPSFEPLAEDLIAELLAPTGDGVIAYRDGRRLIRAYDDLRLEQAAADALRIRRGGSYLITGGLGGIGLAFAEALARDHQARLTLVGLSPLPPRERWDRYLASRGTDRIGKRIRKVRDLEALGAEVLVLSADVADQGQISAVVEQALDRFGSIDGAIHAAGLAGGGMIQLKTTEAAARVLAPKIAGTYALDAALDGQKLDFLLLCSSTIAVAGGFGQVDYCAANSFLDAYAHAQAQAGRPVLSVNWGAWQEVGMAVDSGLMPAGEDEHGERPPVHALIDRAVSETAERSVYETDFDPGRHFVLAEHRIMGAPAIPGTTWLEMARAAYAHHSAAFASHAGLGGVELRDVYFLGPLMVPEGETRTARLLLEPEGSAFSFRVTSSGGPGSSLAHVRGKVGPAQAAAPERHDLEAIRARLHGERLVIEEALMSHEDSVVRWGPRWQSLRTVRLGDGEALAEVELPAAFTDDLSDFVLHPALVDVATSLVGFMEEGTHLPLSYQRVVCRGGVGPRLWSHVTKIAGTGDGRETVSVNVSLLDEDGVERVHIERFTLKTVGDAARSLERSARGEAAAAPHAEVETAGGEPPTASARATARDGRPRSPSVAAGGIRPADGVEALYRMLARRVRLPQIVCSAKDLRALVAEVRSVDRDQLGVKAQSAPRTRHPRPNLPTPFRAPETEIERQLAEVWQSTLGIDGIGANDNFFDLGGDSIIGIQLISRLSDLGLELSPEQLFEHQTVAELARQLAPGTATDATVEDTSTQAFAEAGVAGAALADVIAQFEDA